MQLAGLFLERAATFMCLFRSTSEKYAERKHDTRQDAVDGLSNKELKLEARLRHALYETIFHYGKKGPNLHD